MNRKEKAELYLESLIALGQIFGFSLSHEDFQGSFEVVDQNNKNDRWLLNAKIIKGEGL